MSTNANIRVAMSLLKEVEQETEQKLGNTVAMSRHYSESEEEEVWERSFFVKKGWVFRWRLY